MRTRILVPMKAVGPHNYSKSPTFVPIKISIHIHTHSHKLRVCANNIAAVLISYVHALLLLSEPEEAPTGVSTTVMNSTIRVSWNKAKRVRGLLLGYRVALLIEFNYLTHITEMLLTFKSSVHVRLLLGAMFQKFNWTLALSLCPSLILRNFIIFLSIKPQKIVPSGIFD